MFPKTIAIGLAPNNFVDDVFLALKTVFSFSWKKGKAIESIEQDFKDYFQVSHAYSFNSGRAALSLGLKALGLPPGSQVALQAFSCVVVPNCIRSAGLKPLFIDIEKDSFSMDVNDLRKKISPKTRAIILQNLFGIPDKLEEIRELAQKNNLVLVEDCAQSLGVVYENKMLGSFGKFAFFSFGRDKVISSTFGGMLITSDDKLAKDIHRVYQQLDFPSNFWIFKQLFHPIAFSFIVPSYSWFKIGKFSLGKGILFLMQKLGLLDFPVKEGEKQGKQSLDYPKRLPNGLALLSQNQLKKLDYFNKRRKTIAQYYLDYLKIIKSIQLPKIRNIKQPILLRMPILVNEPEKLREFAKKRNILLGDWYDQVIGPKGVNLKVSGYQGDCPEAEQASQRVVNLPTYPKMTLGDAKHVVNCLKEFYQQ